MSLTASADRRPRNQMAPLAGSPPAIVSELYKVTQLAWRRVQNDAWNRLSLFVYEALTLHQVEEKTYQVARQNQLPVEFIDYAITRWYTQKTHDLTVELFCRHPRVKRWSNPRDRHVDFQLDGIPFDLKLTHMSAARARQFPLAALRVHPDPYILWLYREQSQQERFGLNNRLFVTCYDTEHPAESWKLKRDWQRLAEVIEAYLKQPTHHALELQKGVKVISDLILVSR